METKRRQLIDRRDRLLDVIEDLELKLNMERWTPLCDEWTAAAEKVRLRNYKKAIDNLEGLVVARIFELAKMNMPQTGKSRQWFHVPLLTIILCRLQTSDADF